MSRAKVAVLRVTPATVLADLDRLCDLAGIEGALDLSAEVVLVDDVAARHPSPGAGTTPWQLEGAIAALRRRGAAALRCVAPPDAVAEGEHDHGHRAVLAAHRVPVAPLAIGDLHRPAAPLAALGVLFPDGVPLPAHLATPGGRVQLPTLHCRVDTTVGGASVGALDELLAGRRAPVAAGWTAAAVVELLAIERELGVRRFAIADGTTAGDGGEPRALRPVLKDVVLASADPVALDAVCARMMGFDPLAIDHLRLADARGLGAARPEAIEVVGDVRVADERWGFAVAGSGAALVGELLAAAPLGRLQGLVETPLVQLVAAGAAAYQDHLRWPLVERRVFEDWRRRTRWGALFGRYRREGALLAAAAPAAAARVGEG